MRPVTENAESTRGERVYESLKERIIALDLEPGMPLQEAELTKLYDASRTPVREALARLHHDGFLVRWGRGYRIRSFSPVEVKELYEIREALEKMAIRLTIENADKKKIRELELQLENYSSFAVSGDMKGFNLYANRFHMTIAKLSGNKQLHDNLSLIHEKVRLISARYLFRDESVKEAYEEHLRMYNAIVRQDVVLAEAAMREHIQNVIVYFQKKI